MRLLVIDQAGFALDFCLRCQAAGHQVRWFVRETEKTKWIGKGLVEKVPDWHDWIRWADLVFLSDNTRYLRELDAWRARGVKIIGPSEEAASWELQRTTGMKVLQRAGVPVPPYKEFSNYDQAIAYVKAEMRPFVSKPCGDEPDKTLSYVAKSPADLVYMLERWKKAGKHKSSFILQERVKGIEMAVGGWFGPHGFNAGWCENWEEKKLMVGNLGVATGEQGTTLRYVRKSKLADKVLRPVERQLQRLGYVGYIDVNCIIDDEGTPWPLEFTARAGWPTFNIQQVLHHGDPAEWLLALAEGRDAGVVEMDTVAVGAILSLPDYPYSHSTRKEVCGIPIYKLKPSDDRNVQFCEIMAGEAPHQVGEEILTMPCRVTAGDYVLCASGAAETVSQARDRAYTILNRIEIPNSPMWRVDIGQRLARELPRLQENGYAMGMTY